MKTVRIVKRESKERQKEKSEKNIQSLNEVLEDELNILSDNDKQRFYQTNKISSNPFFEEFQSSKIEEILNYPVSMNNKNILGNGSIVDLSYQSEAAKQIITEISSSGDQLEKQHFINKIKKREIPKEQRRHNTVPHQLNLNSIEHVKLLEQMKRKVSTNFLIRRVLDQFIVLKR